MFLNAPLHKVGSCWHPGGTELSAKAIALSKLKVPARILDVGCGTGHTTQFLRTQGFEAYGIDKEYGLNKVDVCANASQLPFNNNSFQAIMCECVLCLLNSAKQALKEFWRITDAQINSGYLMLSDVYNKEKQDSTDKKSALSLEQINSLLHLSGWRLMHFEDHSQSLKEFFAQMIWHGLCSKNLNHFNYGYGLWIAIKEAK